MSRSTVARWEASSSGPDPNTAEGRNLAVMDESRQRATRIWGRDRSTSRLSRWATAKKTSCWSGSWASSRKSIARYSCCTARHDHPAYGRFLCQLPDGRLTIDRTEVCEEERLDGKYLLRTSDDALNAEDVALGDKQLIEVEDAFRTLKHTLDLRPVYHRLEDRIRSHALLCWLALLLIRVAEVATSQTWRPVRDALQRIYLAEIVTPYGSLTQRTELATEHKALLHALTVPEPPRVLDVRTSPNREP